MADVKGQRLVANPVVVLREEQDDWAVLFNPDTADAVGINPVGVAVWKLLNGTRSINDIVAEVQQRFASVPSSAPEDVRAYVDGLVERGFVGREVEQGTDD